MGKVILDDDRPEIKNPEMIFTDRFNPRRIFWDAFDRLASDEFYVINYHGFGGIGKSRLCRYLNQILSEGKHPDTGAVIAPKTVILNFEDLKNNCEKVNVLENLANKLERECHFAFPLFKYGMYVYYRTQGFSNDSSEIRRIQDNTIAGTVLDAFGLVPIVGDIGSVILKGVDSLAAAMREQVLKNSEYIKRLDNLSSEDIAEELVRIFARELREQTQKEKFPLVIFLDTYEQMQNYVYQISSAKVSEEWLWSSTGLIRRVPNVLWVIAGQRQVTWGKEDVFWTSEENMICEEIREIAEDDLVRDMLTRIGISEPEIVDVIIEKTHGVPVHLALCKDTYFNMKKDGKYPSVHDFDMGYPQLAKRFIGGLSSELKDIVSMLACLEQWTAKDISKLNFSADAYEYILQLSFISCQQGTYTMHHSVQEIVYNDCSDIIREKCLAYFAERLGDADLTTTELKDYTYRKFRLEMRGLLSVEDPERLKEKAALLVAELRTVLRKYLYDAGFFARMKKLIEEAVPDALLGAEFRKQMDVYDFYHCVVRGDYYAAASFVEEKRIYVGHMKMDQDTRGFLYLAMGYYQSHIKEWGEAKNFLLEAYTIWKDTDDFHAIIDVLARLGRVCRELNQYKEIQFYSDLGIEKLKGRKLDTKLACSYCELFVNKCKMQRDYGNMTAAIAYLQQAEQVLEPYADLDNEGICYEYAVVYQQYGFVYNSVKRYDLVKKYSLSDLEITKKTYDINPSVRNRRSLAISYYGMAKVVDSGKEKREYLDQAITLLKDLYEEQPSHAHLEDYFNMVRRAMDQTESAAAERYLQMGREILEQQGIFRISWREKFYFYRAEIMFLYDQEEYDTALEKMNALEEMLEEQKNRLSKDDYWDYVSWNCREYGIIWKQKGDYQKAIRYLERENAIEYRMYSEHEDSSDGVDYADSCRVLSNTYKQNGLLMKAVHYAKKQIAIQERTIEKFNSFSFMKRLLKSYRILAEAYEMLQDKEAAFQAYSAELKYAERVYSGERTQSNLTDIFLVYMELERFLLQKGDYAAIREEYVYLLHEYLDIVGEIDDRELHADVENYMDYLRCLIGKMSYFTGGNLMEAKRDIESSQCPYSNFTEEDRDFYVGKIERRLIDRFVERDVLSKEDGRKLLEA